MSRREVVNYQGKVETLKVAAEVATVQAQGDVATGYANGLRHALAVLTSTEYKPLGEVKPAPTPAPVENTPIAVIKEPIKVAKKAAKKAASRKKVK